MGSQYLQKLIGFFGGDEKKAVAAYNYGPANVQKVIKKASTVAGATWEDYLPKETKQYIKKVIG